MLNEALFIKRLQAKEESAFRELSNEFGPRLLRATKLLTANEQEAEELVSDTLADAFLSINKFKQESQLFNWLYGILLNKFYYRCRRRKREVILESSFDLASQEKPLLPQQYYLLPDLLSKLSPDHQAIILLRYLEGMKLKEIAKVLKISENTVKTRHHRAISNLRDFLKIRNLLHD